MGPISIARLNQVSPKLAEAIYTMERKLGKQCKLGVTQGVRKAVEQRALWMQGRFDLVELNRVRKVLAWAPLTADENGKPVTNAKPGQSWHEYGLAVDVVPENIDTEEPDWNEQHPVWQDIVDIGEALGLTSGISWHDTPHFQLTGRFPVSPTDEVRRIMAAGGMQAVWDAAELQGGSER